MCFSITISYAALPSSIYKITVPVMSKSEMNKKSAIYQACKQVFVKVSGDKNIANESTIDTICNNGKFVQEFSYIRTDDPDRPFMLEVQFDSQAINSVLLYTQKTIWQYRPVILAWVKITKAQKSSIVNKTTKNPISSLMSLYSQEVGIPIIFPNPQDSIPENSANDDLKFITKELAQHHAEGILLGNIEYSDTNLRSHWQLLLKKNVWNWEINDDLPNQIIHQLMSNIVAALLSENNVQAEQNVITMVVNGIEKQSDLSQLLKVLHAMPDLQSANIKNISGSQVQLELKISSNKSDFAHGLLGQPKLNLQGESDKTLVYLWGD